MNVENGEELLGLVVEAVERRRAELARRRWWWQS
jgi:hypothetical protein